MAWRTGFCAWSNGGHGTGSVFQVCGQAQGTRGRLFQYLEVEAAACRGGRPGVLAGHTVGTDGESSGEGGQLGHDEMPWQSS